jgi:hypothetical protein
MSTPLQRAYTVGITLNNMGVYLLEHGCYDAALEAFRDAINVMREISSISEQKETETETETEERPLFSTLDGKLHKANYNLAHCDASKRAEMDVCVLTEEESAPVIGEALQEENLFFNSSTTFLIRIEKSVSDCKSEDVALDSSIILYNYGSLYKCLACNATTAACAKQNYQGASLRRFELSYLLLERDEECSLPVLILILRGIISLSSMLGMKRKAEAYYSQMLNIQDLFLEMHSFLHESIQISAAAA